VNIAPAERSTTPSLTNTPVTPPSLGVTRRRIPAFPGAQGWGAQALQNCDRSQFKVVQVTNLSDSGPGSLREALTKTRGPRIVIFRVAGIISLESTVHIKGDANSCLYVAGQTAPGGGIMIKGSPIRVQEGAHDIVVRYLRFRTDASGAVDVNGGDDIIFDHCSFGWATNDTFDIWRMDEDWSAPNHNVTVQRSIFSEIYASHSTAMNIGGEHAKAYEKQVNNISIHHNLFGHDSHRNPNLSALSISVVNNVMYNWRYRASISKMGAVVDFIGNYYKPGPMTHIESSNPKYAAQIYRPITHESTDENRTPYPDQASIYVTGNVRTPDFMDLHADNWPLLWDEYLKRPLDPKFQRSPWQPLPAPPFPIVVESPFDVYTSIVMNRNVGANARLDCQGNLVINQDPIDKRLLVDAANGTQWFDFRDENGNFRPPNNLSEVGGYPPIDPGKACLDSDQDGMPDEWERSRGLDPFRNDSAQDLDGNGYTNLEEYVNGISQ
jgi:pectate lyase